MAKTATTEPTRIRDLFATRADLGGFMDPRIIKISKGFNVRDYRLPENRAHLDSLKEQIRAYPGVYKPLMVRYDGGQAILIDGESRLTAVLELIAEGMDIKTVPVQTVTTKDEKALLVLSIGSNGGKSLSLLELGIGFARLRKLGMEDAEIASSFGITVQRVNQAIETSELPLEQKQLIAERAITPALAVAVTRKKGSKAATEELKEAVEKHKAAGGKGPVKAAKKKHINPFEELCITIINRIIKEGQFGAGVTIDDVVKFRASEYAESAAFDLSVKEVLKMAKLVHEVK